MWKKLLIICIVIVFSCNKENAFSPVYNVPAEFEPYVQSFISEAAMRGHSMSINNLIIQYDSTLSNLYCAKSNVISAENNVQKIISVNPNLKCWQNSQQLETLFFHEMGHCILGRQHDNSIMPKGYPRSIMYPNDISLYSPCVYQTGDSCNKLYRRTYYIDELFDTATALPDWGK